MFPNSLPIQQDIGKFGLMRPQGIASISHPASSILLQYSTTGCPVDTGLDWTHHQIITALKRRPHISAKEPAAKEYLLKETKEKIQGGYMNIIKWGDIKHIYPKNLKISPVAMIPHKSRSYRCILDLSFQLKVNNKKIDSVNMGTKLQAPQKAMSYLGSVINRLIYLLADNYNKNVPFIFSKCDVKDDFWRMVINLRDAWNFAYVIPSTNRINNIDDIELAIPHALQMGWAESPPYFCSATETDRDVIQTYFTTRRYIPPHPFEHHLTKHIHQHHKSTTPSTSQTMFEVYVDDFIAATNNITVEHTKKMARAILHGIHAIFPPPTVTGHKGEDPISIKTLQQLEGMFATEKEILGWVFNGKDFTIALPTDKCDIISNTITSTLKHNTIQRNNLEKLQGKLVHAATGISGGRGLLPPLYRAVASQKDVIIINNNLKACLQDWKTLLKQIGSRPTSVLELVPRDPEFIAYVD